MKEIRLKLPGDQWSVLDALCTRTGQSMASLICLGLSLAKLALEETDRHHILVIATPDGKALHQVVIPADQRLADCKQREGETLFENIKNMHPPQQSEALDDANLALLQVVNDQSGRLSYEALMSPGRHGVVLPPALGGVSSTERYYRMAFLVHVELVREKPDGAGVVYELTKNAREVLHYARTAV